MRDTRYPGRAENVAFRAELKEIIFSLSICGDCLKEKPCRQTQNKGYETPSLTP